MKLYTSIFKAIDQIKTLLIDAGLVDGITLTSEQLKDSKDTLFWHIAVKNEEGSKKQTYVTYSVISSQPTIYGDGIPRGYSVIIELNLYSNKENVKDVIDEINTSADNYEWQFELSSAISYDHQLNLYAYSFNLLKVITE